MARTHPIGAALHCGGSPACATTTDVVEHVVTDESVEEIDELLVETFRFCLELTETFGEAVTRRDLATLKGP